MAGLVTRSSEARRGRGADEGRPGGDPARSGTAKRHSTKRLSGSTIDSEREDLPAPLQSEGLGRAQHVTNGGSDDARARPEALIDATVRKAYDEASFLQRFTTPRSSSQSRQEAV